LHEQISQIGILLQYTRIIFDALVLWGQEMKYDVCIVGGCGRVGLPLALCFAKVGKTVAIYDINHEACISINNGIMPFHEEGAEEQLKEAISQGRVHAGCDEEVISQSDAVILILGTPVDAHLNPSFSGITRSLRSLIPYLKDGQLLVLRSTVYPGTTEKVRRMLESLGLSIEVAFCPERIAEGYALKETFELPQIVSAFTPEGARLAKNLFSAFTDDIVEVTPLEAEVAKLFTNVWRYIKFAISNQFFTIANDHGLDYYRIHKAITHNYPRAKDLPKAGFAAGPCLFKDTMQLASFANNNFFLGHSAMLINEGLPLYIVNALQAEHQLSKLTVGVLGMAFKGDSDDARESLAYKLRKILEIECQKVLITDPYVADERIIPVEDLIAQSDIIIIGTPHKVYKDLDFKGKEVVDVWDLLGKGGLI